MATSDDPKATASSSGVYVAEIEQEASPSQPPPTASGYPIILSGDPGQLAVPTALLRDPLTRDQVNRVLEIAESDRARRHELEVMKLDDAREVRTREFWSERVSLGAVGLAVAGGVVWALAMGKEALAKDIVALALTAVGTYFLGKARRQKD